MPAMGQTSGQYGAAFSDGEALGTLANWNVNATADQKAFVASNTKGGTGRRGGNVDWSGTAKQYVGWPLGPEMMPAGDQWNFLGFLAPRTGVPGTAGPNIGGICLTESVTLSIDWAASSLVELMTNFVGNGALTYSGVETAFEDLTNPMAIPSREVEFKLGLFSSGAPVWTPTCVLKAALTFKANMYPFSSSCTSGIVKRVAGTKDWSLVITLDEPDFKSLPIGLQQNQIVGAQFIYATGEEITLKWGIVKDITNINVDVETGAMISYDVQIDMSVDSGVDTGIAGSAVTLPDGAGGTFQWWPVVAAP